MYVFWLRSFFSTVVEPDMQPFFNWAFWERVSSLTMKDGTVLVYFCPVMGGHLFLDENCSRSTIYSSECIWCVWEQWEKGGSYTHRIHSMIKKIAQIFPRIHSLVEVNTSKNVCNQPSISLARSSKVIINVDGSLGTC